MVNKMKLSKVQWEALEAVSLGSVQMVEPLSISKPSYIRGARKATVIALEKRGLIEKRQRTGNEYCEPIFYQLTKIGKQALEEIKK